MNEWLIATGGGRIAAILAVAVIILNARLLGAVFGKITGLRIRHPVLSSVVSFMIGVDILLGLTRLAGPCGLFSSPLIKYAMFALAAISLFQFFRSSGFKSPALTRYARRNLVFLIFFAIVGVLTFGNALCLPICWDELCYQLAVPFRWVKDGAICFYPDNPYSVFPGGGTFTFFLNMYLGGFAAPRLFIWVLWMVSLITMYHVLRPGISVFYSTVMTFSFGLSFVMIMCGSAAYGDIIILMHFLCAFAILIDSNYAPSEKGSIALGVICGTASAVKLTGLMVGFSFFIYLAGMALMTKRIKLKSIAIYSGVVFSVVVLFYSRPWVETGNPFYPYCAKYFASSPAAIATSVYHHLEGSEKYAISGISGYFTAPIIASLPENSYDGSLGLQFLPAIILSAISFIYLFKKRKWRSFSTTLFFLLIFYTFWFFSAQLARYMLVVALMTYISAKPCLATRNTLVRALVLLSIVLTLWSIPKILVDYFASSWKCLAGQEKPVDFVYSRTGEGFLQAMDIARMKTPQDAKFLLLFENRGLYMPRRYEIGTPFFQEKYFTPSEDFEDEDKILEVLRKNEITHILVGLSLRDPDRMKGYLDRSVGFSAALGRLKDNGKLKLLWEDSDYIIFECKY